MNHLTLMVGKTAAVELLPNTLLQRAMVTETLTLPPGEAQVGVIVKGGQIPADGLVPGDTVQVLRLPDTGGSARSAADTAAGQSGDDQAITVVERSTVFSSRADPSSTGGTLLTLTVPSQDSAAVAAASGAGQAALVKVAAQ